MQETWVQSLSQEDPLEKEMATHSSTLAWKIPWTEEPGKSRTWLSEFSSLYFWEDLEKGNATHSSILTCRIPWTVHGVPKSRTQLSDFHFTLLHFTVNKLSGYIDWILFTTNGRNYLVHMDMFLNCVFLPFLNAYQNICTPFLNFVFPWSGNYKDGNCERIHL